MDVSQIIKQAGIVKTHRTIDLGDCDEAYRGATFDVWVTPTRGHLKQFTEYRDWLQAIPGAIAGIKLQADEIEDDTEREAFTTAQTERLDREMYRQLDAWLSETWLNLDLDSTTQIREHLQETNPSAWEWLYNETLRTMNEYREGLTKN